MVGQVHLQHEVVVEVVCNIIAVAKVPGRVSLPVGILMGTRDSVQHTLTYTHY